MIANRNQLKASNSNFATADVASTTDSFPTADTNLLFPPNKTWWPACFICEENVDKTEYCCQNLLAVDLTSCPSLGHWLVLGGIAVLVFVFISEFGKYCEENVGKKEYGLAFISCYWWFLTSCPSLGHWLVFCPSFIWSQLSWNKENYCDKEPYAAEKLGSFKSVTDSKTMHF